MAPCSLEEREPELPGDLLAIVRRLHGAAARRSVPQRRRARRRSEALPDRPARARPRLLHLGAGAPLAGALPRHGHPRRGGAGGADRLRGAGAGAHRPCPGNRRGAARRGRAPAPARRGARRRRHSRAQRGRERAPAGRDALEPASSCSRRAPRSTTIPPVRSPGSSSTRPLRRAGTMCAASRTMRAAGAWRGRGGARTPPTSARWPSRPTARPWRRRARTRPSGCGTSRPARAACWPGTRHRYAPWRSRRTARPWPRGARTARSCSKAPTEPPPTSRVLGHHDDFTTGLAFAPDGRTLASSSVDKTVRVWSIASGESRILRGHTLGVWGRVTLGPTAPRWPPARRIAPSGCGSWCRAPCASCRPPSRRAS